MGNPVTKFYYLVNKYFKHFYISIKKSAFFKYN